MGQAGACIPLDSALLHDCLVSANASPAVPLAGAHGTGAGVTLAFLTIWQMTDTGTCAVAAGAACAGPANPQAGELQWRIVDPKPPAHNARSKPRPLVQHALALQIHAQEGPGDILVFLTGQDEIESLERLLQVSLNTDAHAHWGTQTPALGQVSFSTQLVKNA